MDTLSSVVQKEAKMLDDLKSKVYKEFECARY